MKEPSQSHQASEVLLDKAHTDTSSSKGVETGAYGPVLSIVIVSYSTREMTLECIASVKAETQTPFEVIVVDNASSDGSAEAIAKSHPDVKLIPEHINHGFGPAHELALKHARAPWILLLNPDTVVLDGALDKLLAFAKTQPQAKIWGGRTLFGDMTLNPASCFARITLWSIFCRVTGLNGIFRKSGMFNSEYYGAWPRNQAREVDIVSGCLFLIRREFWDALGGFDPAFTMYGEEADLCLRAHKLGAKPMITPDATIIHHGGASERVRSDKLVRLMRAKIELIQRHFPPGQRRVGTALFRLWPLSRRLAYATGARLIGRDTLKEPAAAWKSVWARRAEWQTGLSKKKPATHPAP